MKRILIFLILATLPVSAGTNDTEKFVLLLSKKSPKADRDIVLKWVSTTAGEKRLIKLGNAPDWEKTSNANDLSWAIGLDTGRPNLKKMTGADVWAMVKTLSSTNKVVFYEVVNIGSITNKYKPKATPAAVVIAP
jgi:hypothetical protein